jgi:hypothetical protein
MRFVTDKAFIIILAFIALMMIVLNVAVFGYAIPTLNKTDARGLAVCRAVEQLYDDHFVQLKVERQIIDLRRGPNGLSDSDKILLANNERSSEDLLSINFKLDEECP